MPKWKNNVFGTTNKRQFSVETVSALQVNKFNSGFHLCPHQSKKAKGGEDAVTVLDHFLAAADGVGGWAESGVDPAIYSRKLCSNLEEGANKADERMLMRPKEILVDAVMDNQEMGSATCVVLSLD